MWGVGGGGWGGGGGNFYTSVAIVEQLSKCFKFCIYTLHILDTILRLRPISGLTSNDITSGIKELASMCRKLQARASIFISNNLIMQRVVRPENMKKEYILILSKHHILV